MVTAKVGFLKWRSFFRIGGYVKLQTYAQNQILENERKIKGNYHEPTFTTLRLSAK
jgi:hypothetical protein